MRVMVISLHLHDASHKPCAVRSSIASPTALPPLLSAMVSADREPLSEAIDISCGICSRVLLRDVRTYLFNLPSQGHISKGAHRWVPPPLWGFRFRGTPPAGLAG